MTLRYRSPVMVILCLAVTLPLGSAATVAAEPTAEQLQDAVEFRTTFGLADSMSRVRASFEDSEAFPDMQWGVPLSRDEADDLLLRLERRVGQDDAVEYARDQASFGGVWFDQQDGGAAHYTFTADVARHRAAIVEMAPKGADIHVSQADYRMSDLTKIKNELTKDMLSLIEGGMPITMIDANARANRVIVYLADLEAGDQELLRERYGPAVVTELGAQGVPDACNGPSPYGRGNCRQMKGGLRIEPANGDDCSSAFQARKANGDRVIDHRRSLPSVPRRIRRALVPQRRSVRHLTGKLPLGPPECDIVHSRYRLDQDRR